MIGAIRSDRIGDIHLSADAVRVRAPEPDWRVDRIRLAPADLYR
jgi:hypothetical protein